MDFKEFIEETHPDPHFHQGFLKKLIEKESSLHKTLLSNMTLYKESNRLDLYVHVFEKWAKCNSVLWDLKLVLCKMGGKLD